MPHPGNPIYFKETIPANWSVKGYVKFQHERSERTPRQISDGWPRSLRAIADCKGDCCTQDEIDQANVHHGRWKNKKTADRKYLSQWLADQEASRKRAKSMNSFSIGSVGTLFAGPVDNVYNTADGASSSTAAAPAGISINNSSGVPTPPTVAPRASESDPAAVAAATVPKDKDAFDFQHLLHSFQSTYAAMKTKTLLGSGKYLETEVYTTVMARVASGFKEMNQLLLWVVSLEDPLVVEWFDDELLEEVRVRMLPMPVVGMEVLYAISGFVRPTTAEEYREHAESGSYRKPGERYDKEKHFDAAWVYNAMRHLITLICDTDNLLLSDDLLEGTLECTLWSPLVDLLLADVFVARRRDSSLLAFKARPDILMGADPHFDAVVCNHVRARAATTTTTTPTATAAAVAPTAMRAPDEWGVIEVARKNDGRESVKWRKDSLKMLRGLCALMRCAREYVDCDEETVGRLQFPGLLQAGLETMTIRLTCVGHLFVKQEGELRKVPTTVENIPEALELLESLWLFKKMMVDCQDAIKSYTESKGKRVPPLPTSPNTYCRERMGRPGAL